MRKAINENPMIQLGVLGVGAVVLAFMLFNSVLKKEEPTPATDPATSAAEPAPADLAAPAPAEPAPAQPAPAPSAEGGAAPSTPAPGSKPVPRESGFAPSKGLPPDVVRAYQRNKVVVLLVSDPGGISDGRVREYAERVESRGDSKVFMVNVRDVAEYSRITAGVAVSRTPALVVVRPRKLAEQGPTASVDYGFRSPASVEQAVDDALYDGRDVSAYP